MRLYTTEQNAYYWGVVLKTIADFCGYRTGSALRHIFLARTGMSMREWRRANG